MLSLPVIPELSLQSFFHEPLQRQFFACFEINYSVTKCVFYFYVSIF